MKNKRLTYFLAPLVLLIWGLIFYKIFTHSGGDDKNGMSNRSMQNTDKKDSPKDTFSIKANYRDPFLDRTVSIVRTKERNDNAENRNNRAGVSMRNKPINEIMLPDVKYYGLIANPKNKQKVGLFRMNNKDFILKEGESYNDLKITKLFNDSVKIFYMNNKKTIKKNYNKS